MSDRRVGYTTAMLKEVIYKVWDQRSSRVVVVANNIQVEYTRALIEHLIENLDVNAQAYLRRNILIYPVGKALHALQGCRTHVHVDHYVWQSISYPESEQLSDLVKYCSVGVHDR